MSLAPAQGQRIRACWMPSASIPPDQLMPEIFRRPLIRHHLCPMFNSPIPLCLCLPVIRRLSNVHLWQAKLPPCVALITPNRPLTGVTIPAGPNKIAKSVGSNSLQLVRCQSSNGRASVIHLSLGRQASFGCHKARHLLLAA